MNNQDDGKLLEVLQQEKFLAFFDFSKLGENGTSELDGLCKVARPTTSEGFDYVSLTFIFDTEKDSARNLASRIVARLDSDAFKSVIDNVYATTSVPASVRATPNYVHQIDIIFKGKLPEDLRDTVSKIVYVVRHNGGLHTEPPQFWDEQSAPQPTDAEKANFAARIKAFLGIKK